MNQSAEPPVLIVPACGPAAAGRIAFLDAPIAAAREVALGDVADLSALPTMLRDRAAGLRLALPRGVVAIRTTALAARAQALMPILRCWPARPEPTALAIRLDQKNRPLAARAEPAQGSSAGGDWRHHNSITSEAREAADPDRLGRAVAVAVQAGDTLNLTTDAGPVRVARQVEALQSARAGQRLFVRTGDGMTISVRYARSPQ